MRWQESCVFWKYGHLLHMSCRVEIYIYGPGLFFFVSYHEAYLLFPILFLFGWPIINEKLNLNFTYWIIWIPEVIVEGLSEIYQVQIKGGSTSLKLIWRKWFVEVISLLIGKSSLQRLICQKCNWYSVSHTFGKFLPYKDQARWVLSNRGFNQKVWGI